MGKKVLLVDDDGDGSIDEWTVGWPNDDDEDDSQYRRKWVSDDFSVN